MSEFQSDIAVDHDEFIWPVWGREYLFAET